MPTPVIHVGNLNDPRLRLRQPLAVQMRREDLYWVAWNGELEEYGIAETFGGAIEDFQQAIAGLYRSLIEEEHRLGPWPQFQLRRLRAVIEERNP